MNEQTIWDFLYKRLKNNYGVAGLMGNLFAESSLNPIKANGISKHGLTNAEYTAIADSGVNNNFISDGIAYGLVQWCFHTRKRDLLEKAKSTNRSVGDLNVQLEYMWDELQKYKTVLNTLYNATSLKEATDIVMLKYEKPANTSDAAKEKRLSYAKKYYKTFVKTETVNIILGSKQTKEIFNKLKGKL